MRHQRRLSAMTRRRLLAGLLPAVLVAACTGAAAPATTLPSGSLIPLPTTSAPSPVPSGGGGAVGGSPGTGVTPIPIGPGGPGASGPPLTLPSPEVQQPVAGLLDVHDVRAESFSVDSSGGTVKVTVVWWSGPAPCSQLAEVAVAKAETQAGAAFTLTVREGAQQLGIACPALAMHKQATVDLGAIRDQTWTITVTGVDAPQTIRVGG